MLVLSLAIVLPVAAFATSRLHTTYVVWGSSTCPNTFGTSQILSGLMAGHRTAQTSDQLQFHGGTDFLCAPINNVQYNPRQSIGGVQNGNILVGTEYHNAIQPEVNHHNVPCAVCLVTSRTTTVMHPGMTSCPEGKMEYQGYLMGQYQDYSTYVCVDERMEMYMGTRHSEAISHLVHVEASCEGLPCSPYVDTKELSCVVCSI